MFERMPLDRELLGIMQGRAAGPSEKSDRTGET